MITLLVIAAIVVSTALLVFGGIAFFLWAINKADPFPAEELVRLARQEREGVLAHGEASALGHPNVPGRG